MPEKINKKKDKYKIRKDIENEKLSACNSDKFFASLTNIKVWEGKNEISS